MSIIIILLSIFTVAVYFDASKAGFTVWDMFVIYQLSKILPRMFIEYVDDGTMLGIIAGAGVIVVMMLGVFNMLRIINMVALYGSEIPYIGNL